MPDFTKMNEAQAEAVKHIEGPALIVAGPGSGKTFVITNRIVHLIESCLAEPSSILVITFTKAAADSMQKRFLKFMNGRPVPVRFGTFHSIFFHFLQKYKDYRPQDILSGKEKTKYITEVLLHNRQALKEAGYQDAVIEGELAPEMLSLISLYKNTPDQTDTASVLPVPGVLFRRICEEYQRMLDEDNRLDFDDMLIKCLVMFQSRKAVLAECRNQYKYILIDEFQDSNPVQYEIIKLLAAEHHNIFAVGDDDQSIYGFRGANPGILKQFMRDYPNAKQILLSINYRSESAIVQAANKMVAHNRMRFGKSLRSAGEPGKGEMNCLGFDDKEKQFQYLTERIAFLHRSMPYEEMAVIFRTNREMEALAEYFVKAGIPYQAKETIKSRYEHFVINGIVECLLFATGKKRRPPEALTLAGVRAGEITKLSDYSPFTAIHILRKVLGYDNYLKRKTFGNAEKEIEWLSLAEDLQQEARKYLSFTGWLEEIENYKELWQQQQKSGGARQGIWMLTMHASKGLEYGYVCLPGVNEGTVPHGRTLTDEAVEEERRMLYVGMTRAKTALDILYVTGTKEHPKLPSRFLNPFLND